MSMMTYEIVSGKTPDILTKNVNAKLAEGWSLYEGVVYADGRFHQAMVLYPPMPELVPFLEEKEFVNDLGW